VIEHLRHANGVAAAVYPAQDTISDCLGLGKGIDGERLSEKILRSSNASYQLPKVIIFSSSI
jgi:hypothetical protein